MQRLLLSVLIVLMLLAACQPGQPGPAAQSANGPTGRIVFQSNRDNNLDLYIINADGSGLRRLTKIGRAHV